jgi:hypothetical protein
MFTLTRGCRKITSSLCATIRPEARAPVSMTFKSDVRSDAIRAGIGGIEHAQGV